MSRVCEITGSKVGVGHNVSHSNRHTKRTFRPNLHSKTYISAVLGRTVTLTLTARAIRTLDKYNGLDGYMLAVKNRHVRANFSAQATKIRSAIIKKNMAAAS
jgi:large subunit ribosomal protein L28